jgi:sugar transferase EpsL
VSPFQKIVKRVFDVVVSALALLVFSPVLLGVALVVYLRIGKPVLFLHQRPGLNEEPFYLYKFRTMLDTRDADGALLPDKDRVSPFGQKLRKTSLDELPSLLNVLRGDLSLVGPRPLLMRYAPYYEDWQRRRFAVKPGLTGLAQVNGRNAISWDEKFRYDIEYVENRSLWMDIKILFRTVGVVLSARDISDGKHPVAQLPFDHEHRQ